MTATEPAALSEREKEALRLLLVGHDAKSIASRLGLSVYTVNDRLREARRKMAVSSSREAARRLAEMEVGEPNILVRKDFGNGSDVVPAAELQPSALVESKGHRLIWLAGGMLVMSVIIASVALSTMLATSNGIEVASQSTSSAATRPAETEASGAARKWVTLLDDAQWDASWQAAGKMFKAQLPPVQWVSTIQSVRQPLGQVRSRTLQSAVPTKTLPGAPSGDYQVLQFETRFANKPDAVETVVLSKEQSGWRVDGYFIR